MLHTCAILDNGAVSCWGDGAYGRLGNGGTSSKTTPTLTSSLGTGRTAALSERDFNDDGAFNIFQAHSNLDYRESTLSSGGPTPAPSLTTVMCRAGDTDITANWVMEEHLTKPLPRSPAALVQVAQQ